MSSKTPNFNLHKIDLTDAPPDITMINPNWDTIDTQLKSLKDSIDDAPTLTVDSALSSTSTNPVQNKVINSALAGKAPTNHTHDYLPLTGGVLSGALTVIDNFNVNKTFDGVEYKSYTRPINYSIGNNDDYSTGLIHYKGTVNQAQLMFNKDGVMLRDNVNAKAYHLFGQHNTDKIATVIESLGVARVATGSYNGTGTHNSSGKTSVTLDFVPKFFWVHSSDQTDCDREYLMPWQTGLTTTNGPGQGNFTNNWSVSGTTISWYSTANAKQQMNTSAVKYYWVAIG